MKLAKKILSGLLGLMLIVSVLSGAAFAEEGYRTCTVECLTFEVPEDMLVLAQGMAEDDPSLEYLGLTPDEVDEILGTINLLITPKVDNWDVEISVYPRGTDSIFTPEAGSMSNYSEEELNELLDEMNEGDPDESVELNYIDGYPFFAAIISGGDDFTVMYITTVGDLEVVIMFYGDGPEPEANMLSTWADILERVTIEDVSGTAAESEEAAEEPVEEPVEEPEEPVEEIAEEPEEDDFEWDTEGSRVYEMPDAGLNIEIPNKYFTMTRGMAEDDPFLLGLGLDPETVDELMDSFGRELNVVPNDLSWEFSLKVETSEDFGELGDCALFSEKDFKKSFEGIEDELMDVIDEAAESAGMGDYNLQIENSGTVVLGGYNYYWMDISFNAEGMDYSNERVYVTLFGGTQYLFTMAYTDDVQAKDAFAAAEELLSNVEFTAEPTGITGLSGFLGSLPDGLVTGVIIGAVTGVVVVLVCVLIGQSQRKSRQKKAAARAKAETRPDPWETDWSERAPQPDVEQRSERNRSEYGYSMPDDNRNDPPYMN